MVCCGVGWPRNDGFFKHGKMVEWFRKRRQHDQKISKFDGGIYFYIIYFLPHRLLKTNL
jgi:hypothetical protein